MHHSVTEMCIHVTQQCIVGYWTGALSDLWIRSIIVLIRPRYQDNNFLINTWPVVYTTLTGALTATICHIAIWRYPLQWHDNERNGVSNYRRVDCLLNQLFRRRSNKTPKLLVTDFCERNRPVAGGFIAQWASNAQKVSFLMTSSSIVRRQSCQ